MQSEVLFGWTPSPTTGAHGYAGQGTSHGCRRAPPGVATGDCRRETAFQGRMGTGGLGYRAFNSIIFDERGETALEINTMGANERAFSEKNSQEERDYAGMRDDRPRVDEQTRKRPRGHMHIYVFATFASLSLPTPTTSRA
jgi:hypothetical protein